MARPQHALSSHIVVIGAGAFGGWAALSLEAMDRWRDYDIRWKAGLMHRTGVPWMNGGVESANRPSKQ